MRFFIGPLVCSAEEGDNMSDEDTIELEEPEEVREKAKDGAVQRPSNATITTTTCTTIFGHATPRANFR